MSVTQDFFHPNNCVSLNETICFNFFDKNNKGQLDLQDFLQLCMALFRNAKGIGYELEKSKLHEIFSVFDKNNDGFIDKNEFQDCWNKWINVIIKPKSALLIIDVQNDFISGSLNISNCPAKHNGADVVPPINALLESVKFDSVFYSLDWHPKDHISFVENVKLREVDPSSKTKAENAKPFDDIVFTGPPKITQKVFPAHCLQNGWGAELHSELKIPDNAIKIYKGTNSNVDSFSAFFDNHRTSQTKLNEVLKKAGITDLYVCGLAWDYCVGSSVLHALELAFRTVAIDDCIRGIDNPLINAMKEKIIHSNGVILNSECVGNIVKGLDRLPTLAYKLAMDLK